jgi:hypothetical protein
MDLCVLAEDEEAGKQKHQRNCDQRRQRIGEDVNDPTGKALLTVMPPDTAPIERVPAVMDLNFLPDMGRMTG